MKNILFIAFLLSLSTSYSQYTAQERAEESVKKHLDKVFTKEQYKSYGFNELYKNTPPKIAEINQLKKEVDSLRVSNSLTNVLLKFYDSTIKAKEDTVRVKKIYSYYDIKHYFVVNEGDNKHSLNYFKFELFPDGKIKDLEKIIKFQFVGEEYDWFYNYYRKNTLIENNPDENQKCYNYLDELLKNNKESKESALITVLATHSTIFKHGYMDTGIIARNIAHNWLTRNLGKNVVPVKYSKLSSIKENSKTIGYKLFVEYELNGEKAARYFEFNDYYVLKDNLIMKNPYDSFFETKN